MAYSLGDPYGTLRTVLRVDGVVVGWALGALLLLAPKAWLAERGIWLFPSTWPVRMAGALLLALGLLLVWMAQERPLPPALLATTVAANGLMALVLTLAYLRQEFYALATVGRVGLVLVILVCLAAALAPLPHLRTEARLR